jgi:hypothetical protein
MTDRILQYRMLGRMGAEWFGERETLACHVKSRSKRCPPIRLETPHTAHGFRGKPKAVSQCSMVYEVEVCATLGNAYANPGL